MKLELKKFFYILFHQYGTGMGQDDDDKRMEIEMGNGSSCMK